MCELCKWQTRILGGYCNMSDRKVGLVCCRQMLYVNEIERRAELLVKQLLIF